MRIDRLVTLHVAARFSDNVNGTQSPRVAILMYHGISEKQDTSIHPYYQTNTLPKVFETQIEFLWANKYKVIDLRDVSRLLNAPDGSAGNYVVITFDDAYRNVYENAFPVLRKYGYTATIYIPTDFIDEDRREFQDKSCMTWDEAETLRAAGFTFGSHTATHSRLIDMEPEEIEYELKHSKAQIERRLAVEVESFSYPFSFPDGNNAFLENFKQLVRKIGYKHIVTTNIGTLTPDDDGFVLKRIPVNSWDDLELFHAKLCGGYDWVRVPQYLFKAYVKIW